MGLGTHVDDPPPPAAEPIEQEVGEHEVAQMVRGEGELEPFRRHLAPALPHSGIVHEDVDAVQLSCQPLSELSHILEVGEIRDLEIDVGFGALVPDLGSRSLAALLAATHHRHARTRGRQQSGGRPTDT